MRMIIILVKKTGVRIDIHVIKNSKKSDANCIGHGLHQYTNHCT